jgi:hypothetical protein
MLAILTMAGCWEKNFSECETSAVNRFVILARNLYGGRWYWEYERILWQVDGQLNSQHAVRTHGVSVLPSFRGDAVGASRIAILHSATRLLLATGSERL